MWDKSDHNTSELKVFLVTSAEQTIEIVNQIKDEAIRDSTKDIILGMDWEGLNIARPISLLQVSEDAIYPYIDVLWRYHLYIRFTFSQPLRIWPKRGK